MNKRSILIVDDNKNVLTALRIFLGRHFGSVETLSSPNSLMSTIRAAKPDIVLLDMNFSAGINSGNEGLYWLSEIKKTDPDIPVVVFTAYAEIDIAVRALKEGAADFVVKPWENAKLLETLKSAFEAAKYESVGVKKRTENSSAARIKTVAADADICWGGSQPMEELKTLIGKIARTEANILITGENGVGKEVVASMIHRMSDRANKVFVTVDMGAVAETLFESELFGHVKGAFTDAREDRAGKFEAAHGGTLFLDEIGNLSLPLQAKMLTALQAKQVVRVGSNRPVDVDIRLICATNRDLDKAVSAGGFREDLLYRINTIRVEVPPLRHRKEDIGELSRFFLDKFARKYAKEGMEMTDAAIEKLTSYDWPGNIRQLQHAVEKAVILSDSGPLDASDFMFDQKDTAPEHGEYMTIEEMEKSLIERTLKKHDGNISVVSTELGITRPTLYSKLKKYGL